MSILVTPNPSSEAVALMDYLLSISGVHTLAGQHCAPLAGDTRLVNVYRMLNHYPALFGQDFGFSAPGTWDGINFRQRIVDDAIRRHYDGFIITLMWHAVPPTEDEPVVFEQSIQCRLTDVEWEDLITPGTRLHERWKAQVDVIAWFLRQLRDASVPVLWRPYHEMNGGWFWWGKQPGEMGYKRLYRMLFERLVYFHGLNNLIWVYNANEVRENVDPYADYYPGDDVVDILATDVYRGGFAQTDYDHLLALASDKPIALGEVGAPPKLEILQAQPRWLWFMVWGELFGFWQEREAYQALYDSTTTITLADLPWAKIGWPKLHHPVLK